MQKVKLSSGVTFDYDRILRAQVNPLVARYFDSLYEMKNIINWHDCALRSEHKAPGRAEVERILTECNERCAPTFGGCSHAIES